MKFSLVFAVLATVSSMVAPVASAPIVQERAVEKRAFSGRGTWFDVGLGACGKRNNNNQPIIAMNKSQYSQKLCGKWITITANGKTAKGYVEDMCPSCKKGALDLSPSLFKKFAPLSKGVVTVKWNAPSTKRSLEDSESSGGDLVIRAGPADGTEPADEQDDEYNFDPADAVTDEELEELLNAKDDDETAEADS